MSVLNQAIRLKVSEIFFSLQGESTRVGLPTVFVRLTGCPLRCVWCDSAHAFSGGSRMRLEEILQQVAQYQVKHVCVTGGEPLAQKHCLVLLKNLCDAGYSVSLETSGALDIIDVDPRVSRIVDLKAPGSGEADKNLWINLERINSHDELKFVLSDRADYEWARAVVREEKTGILKKNIPILFSAVHDSLDPRELAEWIVQDRLEVRFQLQLHKQLWGNVLGK